MERITQLPRAKQKFVMEMLDTVIQQLPGTVGFEEIVYRLYVLRKINPDMKEDRGIS